MLIYRILILILAVSMTSIYFYDKTFALLDPLAFILIYFTFYYLGYSERTLIAKHNVKFITAGELIVLNQIITSQTKIFPKEPPEIQSLFTCGYIENTKDFYLPTQKGLLTHQFIIDNIDLSQGLNIQRTTNNPYLYQITRNNHA